MARETDHPHPATVVRTNAWRGLDAAGKPVSALGLEKWVKKKLGLDIDDAGFIEMGGMRLARDSKAARAAGWNDIADMLDKFEDMTSEEQLEAWTKQAP